MKRPELHIGPLMVRPCLVQGKPHPHVIDYYWRGRYILTSGPWYIIVRHGDKTTSFSFLFILRRRWSLDFMKRTKPYRGQN